MYNLQEGLVGPDVLILKFLKHQFSQESHSISLAVINSKLQARGLPWNLFTCLLVT